MRALLGQTQMGEAELRTVPKDTPRHEHRPIAMTPAPTAAPTPQSATLNAALRDVCSRIGLPRIP